MSTMSLATVVTPLRCCTARDPEDTAESACCSTLRTEVPASGACCGSPSRRTRPRVFFTHAISGQVLCEYTLSDITVWGFYTQEALCATVRLHLEVTGQRQELDPLSAR